MIKVKRNINGNVLVANVENYMKEQAEALLDIISNIERLKNNFKIQIGFTIFTLLNVNEEMVILAPDYNKNPFIDTTEDLTIALWVQLEQGILLNKLKLDGELISFQDKIICSKNALKFDNIYLQRSLQYEKGDSGWYIGTVDEKNRDEELEIIYAYQILKMKPSILQALALPNGHIAVFNKDRLEAVLDENDIDILKNIQS